MRKIVSRISFLAPIVIIFTVVAHIDHEMVMQDDRVVIGDIGSDSTPVNTEEEEILSFTLEKRFEKRERVGDYWVETYREYEVYVDNEGNVVEVVPTSTFDYIRYWAKE